MLSGVSNKLLEMARCGKMNNLLNGIVVADIQCGAQVGNRDSWGHLQHADAAGGSGRRESQTGSDTHRPHGSSQYGTHTLLLL